MFDYQAGEKYRLTLMMTAVAGLIAGSFFTMILMPTPEPVHRKHGGGMSERVASNPDITGGRSGPAGVSSETATPAAPVAVVDRSKAQQFMVNWLPRIWDLSAGSAKDNQEMAIKYMTPDCAAAYRRNVWTADLGRQVQESGLQSTFNIKSLNFTDNLQDGSIVAQVQGVQTLGVPGKKARTREVNLEYMLEQTPDGPRVAGISEGRK